MIVSKVEVAEQRSMKIALFIMFIIIIIIIIIIFFLQTSFFRTGFITNIKKIDENCTFYNVHHNNHNNHNNILSSDRFSMNWFYKKYNKNIFKSTIAWMCALAIAFSCRGETKSLSWESLKSSH